ncbi:MAG TPA: VOC family protein [Ignavibacteria bacterium]|nr:VOC family protein [Ignavibacteria bacterium]
MASAINWFEIPAVDFERGFKFYSAIFGSELTKMDMNGYLMGFFPAEKGVGGAIVSGEGMEPSQNGVMVYLNGGDDLSDMLAKVEPAGGKVVVPKTQITPEIGYFAVFIDTEGNKVAMHSPK